FQRRGDHLAGAAPLRPEIDDDGLLGIEHVGLEIVLVDLDGGHGKDSFRLTVVPDVVVQAHSFKQVLCHASVSRASASSMTVSGSSTRRAASVNSSAAAIRRPE